MASSASRGAASRHPKNGSQEKSTGTKDSKLGIRAPGSPLSWLARASHAIQNVTIRSPSPRRRPQASKGATPSQPAKDNHVRNTTAGVSGIGDCQNGVPSPKTPPNSSLVSKKLVNSLPSWKSGKSWLRGKSNEKKLAKPLSTTTSASGKKDGTHKIASKFQSKVRAISKQDKGAIASPNQVTDKCTSSIENVKTQDWHDPSTIVGNLRASKHVLATSVHVTLEGETNKKSVDPELCCSGGTSEDHNRFESGAKEELNSGPALFNTTGVIPKTVSSSSERTTSAHIVPKRQDVRGRRARRDIKSDSELYGDAHLKAVLQVLRSNLSPEEKLAAIKCSHDYWETNRGRAEALSLLEEHPCPMSQIFQENDLTDSGKIGTLPSVAATMLSHPSCCESDSIQESRPLPDTVEEPLVPLQDYTGDAANHDTCLERNISGDIQTSHISEGICVPPLEIAEPQVSVTVQSNTPDEDRSLETLTVNTGASNTLSIDHHTPPPKSPVSVQDWIDSIEFAQGTERVEEIATQCHEQEPTSQDSGYHSTLDNCHGVIMPGTLQEDNLKLGAEAHNLDDLPGNLSQANGASSPVSSPRALTPARNERITLANLRSKQSSFNSEVSVFSTLSSISSVDSLLEARQEDPEEVLRALGFGGALPEDRLSRVPQRFLAQPSIARGVDVDAFLQQQERLLQQQEQGSGGFSGMSGQWQQSLPRSIIKNRGETTSCWSLPTVIADGYQSPKLGSVRRRKWNSRCMLRLGSVRKNRKVMGVKFMNSPECQCIGECMHDRCNIPGIVPHISVTGVASPTEVREACSFNFDTNGNPSSVNPGDWWDCFVATDCVTLEDEKGDALSAGSPSTSTVEPPISQKHLIRSSLV